MVSPLSQSSRVQLSIRAKQRREALGLSLRELAEALNINLATIKAWEECLIQKPKVEIESKWEALLQAPNGWLRDASNSAQPVRRTTAIDLTNANSASDEIQLIANWLAKPRLYARTSNKAFLKNK